MSSKNPWKFLDSYKENDGYEFLGREKDVNEVTNLICNNLLTTLYGKSGIGKTSLLNAGVFCKARNLGFSPVVCRFVDGQDPQIVVKMKLIETFDRLKDYENHKLSMSNLIQDVLYEKYKEETLPIIVFDQFEELLRNNVEHAKSLILAINDMVNPRYMSQDQRTNYRYVISIREDYLYLLEDVIDELRLPELKTNRYRLLPLSEESADRVIGLGDQYMQEGEVENLHKKIKERSKDNNGKIVTNLLSLYCSELYRQGEGKIGDELLKKNEDDFLYGYYQHCIEGFTEKERTFLEENLVKEGLRNPVPMDTVKNRLNGEKYKKITEEGDSKILHTVTIGEQTYHELIHDKLALAIEKKKKTRAKQRTLSFLRLLSLLLPLLILAFVVYYELEPRNKVTQFYQNDARKEFVLDYNVQLVGFHEIEHLTTKSGFYIQACNNLRSISVEPENEDAKISLYILNCPVLRTIELSEKVMNIEGNGVIIENCPSLKKLRLGQNVESIGTIRSENLVIEVDSLNEVFTWDNGTLWDKHRGIAFMQGSLLKSKRIEVPFPEWCDMDSVLYDNHVVYPLDLTKPTFEFSEDSATLIYSPKYRYYKDIDLSEYKKLKTIGEGAFKDCTKLERVTLPDEVEIISNEAFENCYNLKEISPFKSLTRIDNKAFDDCKSLKELDFSLCGDVGYNKAFNGCINLEKVVLSKGKGDVTNDAFMFCPNVRFEAPEKSDFVINDNYVLNKANDELVFIVQNDFHTLNNSKYFSKYGGLFEKGKEVKVLDISRKAFDKYESQILGDGVVGELFSKHEHGLVSYKNIFNVIVLLPEEQDSCVIIHDGPHGFTSFRNLPEKITELYVYKKPSLIYDSPKGEKWSLTTETNIPDYLKQDASLYVPNGRASSFYVIEAYSGFKEIKEQTKLQGYYNVVMIVKDYLSNYFRAHLLVLMLSILGYVFACSLMVLITYYFSKGESRLKLMTKVIGAFLYSVILVPLTFVAGFWFMFLTLGARGIWPAVVGVVSVVVLILLWVVVQKTTFGELWKMLKTNLKKEKTINILLRIFLTILGVVLFAIACGEYSTEVNEYKSTIEETCRKLIKDDSNKALALLNEGLTKSTIKSDSILYRDFENKIESTSHINSVSFSPDGKCLATGSDDDTAILWEVSSGDSIMSLKGHNRGVNSVSFSPDGKYLATGSSDKTAILWEVSSGDMIMSFKGHNRGVNSVSFSPDGKYLATGSDDDTAILWEVLSGDSIMSFKGHSDCVKNISFSADGKYLATGSYDDTAILWEVSSGDTIRSFKGHNGGVNSVSFSPDGKYLATGSYDNTAILWEASSGELKNRFKSDRYGSMNSVSFSRDGKYLATSGFFDKVILWNVDSGKEERTYDGWARDVKFSPNGKYIVGASDDFCIIWDAESADVVSKRTIDEYMALIQECSEKVVLTEDEKNQFGFNCDKIEIWVYLGIFVLLIFALFVIWRCDFIVIISIEKALLIIVALISAYKVYTLYSKKTQEYVNKVAAAYSEYIDKGEYEKASEFLNYAMPRWSVNDIKWYNVLNEFGRRNTNAAALSPDGKYLATGSYDNTAILWEVSSGDSIMSFKGHNRCVNSVSFSPDGKYLATGSNDDTAILWEVSSGDTIRSFKGHINDVNSVSFSPDGKYLATGSYDNTAILWEVSSGDSIMSFNGHSNGVNSVSFSLDGKYLATGSSDNTAILWEVLSGDSIMSFKGHNRGVTSVSFSPDGKYVITNSGSETKLWGSNNEFVQKSQTALLTDGDKVKIVFNCEKWKYFIYLLIICVLSLVVVCTLWPQKAMEKFKLFRKICRQKYVHVKGEILRLFVRKQ